jgi:hypothetical protein
VLTFVDIAGGPKGEGLKQQIEAGQYPGIVKTTLEDAAAVWGKHRAVDRARVARESGERLPQFNLRPRPS